MADTAIMQVSSNLDKKKGSLFAQLFEEVMCEGIERKMEFNTIMTEIHYRISRIQPKTRNSSTVDIVTRLRHQYYFKVKQTEIRDGGTNSFTKDKPKWKSLEAYDTPPGFCVIFNNMKFENDESTISCGEVDEAAMKRILEPCGFKVDTRRNLTKSEMIDVLEEYQRKEHTGCFIVIVLSHGANGVVLGSDEEGLSVEDDIVKRFSNNNCKSLTGKPRIFIIDTCRIEQGSAENAVGTKTIFVKPPVTTESWFKKMEDKLVEDDDFAILYATVPGKPAYFDSKEGSIFTCFFEIVTKEAIERNIDFDDIINEVKYRVANYETPVGNSQRVQTINNFTKKYYFKWIEEVQKGRRLQKKLKDTLCEWKGIRENTVRMVQNTAANLMKHRRNVNISRITGSIAAIGGSGIAILGIALTPVTFGGSVLLTISGAAVATAGGLTAAGASIADTLITKSGVTEAQKQVIYDQDKLREIQRIQEQIENQNKRIREKCPDLNEVDIFMVTAVSSKKMLSIIQGTARVANLAFKIGTVAVMGAAEVGVLGLRVGGAVVRSMAAAGIILNVVIIPIDLIQIVRNGWNIYNGNESQASKRLCEIAVKLEQEKRKICDQFGV